MTLTPAQLTALKTDILANTNQAVIDALNNGDAGAIAAWYSSESSPAFYVWRTDITPMELNEVIDWSEVVALTTNEMLALQLLKDLETIDASKSSLRGAFTAIFPANQQPNTNAALTTLSKRLATNIERVFATGTGGEGSPATMSYEGTVTYQVISQALQS